MLMLFLGWLVLLLKLLIFDAFELNLLLSLLNLNLESLIVSRQLIFKFFDFVLKVLDFRVFDDNWIFTGSLVLFNFVVVLLLQSTILLIDFWKLLVKLGFGCFELRFRVFKSISFFFKLSLLILQFSFKFEVFLSQIFNLLLKGFYLSIVFLGWVLNSVVVFLLQQFDFVAHLLLFLLPFLFLLF